MATTDLAPRAFLQLAGHPLRWRLLADLARSDHTVRELTHLLDQPQNLVSYHLGKLREVGLVVARRSSADRRDAYYSVDLTRLGTVLSSVGGDLHPGLAVLPSPNRSAAPSQRQVANRVLFVCTGNSARSQIAEAFAREYSDGSVEAHSAGSQPKPVHPNAVRVMGSDFGIDLTAHRPKHLDEFEGKRFDRVVTMCDRVREVCPEFVGQPEATHWSVPDPAAGFALGEDEASYPMFQLAAAEIATRVEFLLAALDDPSVAPSHRPVQEQS